MVDAAACTAPQAVLPVNEGEASLYLCRKVTQDLKMVWMGAYHCRAVQRGKLPAALNLNARVVNAAALQRRQKRLHGMHAACAHTVSHRPSAALQSRSCMHAHSRPSPLRTLQSCGVGALHRTCSCPLYACAQSAVLYVSPATYRACGCT